MSKKGKHFSILGNITQHAQVKRLVSIYLETMGYINKGRLGQYKKNIQSQLKNALKREMILTENTAGLYSKGSGLQQRLKAFYSKSHVFVKNFF